MTKAFVALLALLASQCVSAWTPHVTSRGRVLRLQAENSVDRRSWIAAAATAVVAAPNFAYAETAQPELSEEELARIEKKKALLAKKASSVATSTEAAPYGADIRSDINPEAGSNLRKASLSDNMKKNKSKQDAMKNRSSTEKREDLCEMLGRGC